VKEVGSNGFVTRKGRKDKKKTDTWERPREGPKKWVLVGGKKKKGHKGRGEKVRLQEKNKNSRNRADTTRTQWSIRFKKNPTKGPGGGDIRGGGTGDGDQFAMRN